MSSDTFVSEFRNAIPSLQSNHKGQHGRIGVIGGCEEYTGAPYFAAISALRAGADLSHVFCTSGAAVPIKSYSPELIVHPVLDRPNSQEYMTEWITRLHALVIGPGLGRSPDRLPLLHHIVQAAKSKHIPLIFDADGLHFVNNDVSLVQGYSKAILTPNAVEFNRLYETVIGNINEGGTLNVMSSNLAREMGNVTLLVKGPSDIVTNGRILHVINETGSNRRCGGQGDILSGVLGTFSCWTDIQSIETEKILKPTACMLACIAASALTRTCNALAFEKYGRSMITSDMIKFIGKSFETHFGA